VPAGATYPSKLYCGLDYLVGIDYHTPVTTLNDGIDSASKKKITRVSPNLYNSMGVTINDRAIVNDGTDWEDGDVPAPVATTGVVRKRFLGWGLEPYVTVRQTIPGQLIIRNMGMEVKT
jgi:hypothetical protein